ncbi:hypothetical protein [Burkholderia sp. 9777_1386]|uniref:hypothetical protein n=1 Tax=Burkholderia sp. 9777_1386 TaxID=2751183 RepID=UPI003FA43375
MKRSSSGSHSTPGEGRPACRAWPRRDHADVAARHAHTIQQRGFVQHPRQIAGQQNGRASSIAEPPHAAAQIIDAVTAFDTERKAYLLTQRVLVQGQCGTIVRFDGDWPHSGQRHMRPPRPSPQTCARCC